MPSKKNEDGTITLDMIIPVPVKKTVNLEKLREERETLAAQIQKHAAGLAGLENKLAQMDLEIAECESLEGK